MLAVDHHAPSPAHHHRPGALGRAGIEGRARSGLAQRRRGQQTARERAAGFLGPGARGRQQREVDIAPQSHGLLTGSLANELGSKFFERRQIARAAQAIEPTRAPPGRAMLAMRSARAANDATPSARHARASEPSRFVTTAIGPSAVSAGVGGKPPSNTSAGPPTAATLRVISASSKSKLTGAVTLSSSPAASSSSRNSLKPEYAIAAFYRRRGSVGYRGREKGGDSTRTASRRTPLKAVRGRPRVRGFERRHSTFACKANRSSRAAAAGSTARVTAPLTATRRKPAAIT